MLVPAWSTPEDFWALEAAGLTMYGQMTAAGWFYIGTQGILGFTYETFGAVARTHFDGTLAGQRVLTAGLGGMGGAQGLGVALNGGRVLAVEVDPRRARRRAGGGLDRPGHRRLSPGARRARRARTGRRRSAWSATRPTIVPRLVRDRIHFDVVTDQTAAHDLLHGYVPAGYTVDDAARAAADDAGYLDGRPLVDRAPRGGPARAPRPRSDCVRVRQQPPRRRRATRASSRR